MRQITILLIFLPFSTFGQWKKIKFIDKPLVTISSTPSGDKIFLGTGNAEIGRSTDLGKSFEFQQMESGGYIVDFLFENEKLGWAAGGCLVDNDSCSANTIYKTTDAGNTWKQIHKTAGVGKITDLQKLDNRLFALSEFKGIFISNDNGKIFKLNTIDPKIKKGSFVDFQMFEGGVGYLSHSFMTIKKLYKTIDGGETWFNIFESDLRTFTANFHFSNDQIGFIKMARGSLFKTNNGGNTWTEIQIVNQLEAINEIEFLNNDLGFLAARHGGNLRGNLYQTEDGGNTWNQELGMETTYWTDLHIVNEEVAYLLADDNKILKRGTSEELALNRFGVFPNPFREEFTIRLEYYYRNYQFEIYNVVGQLMAKERLIDFENVLRGDFFENGYYYLKIIKDDNELVYSKGFAKY